MFESKALKDFPDKKRSKLYLWWIDTTVFGWYKDFTWKFIRNPIVTAKKVWGWYRNVLRYDYDFDGHCLFAIIEYKLKCIQKSLINGHAIQEEKDMKALVLATKLADRLKKDNYDEPFYDRHQTKWGEMETWFEPCKDKPGYSTWHSFRPNANTPEEKEQERKEHLAMMYAAEAKREREQKWLFDILHKYIRVWWD